MSICFKDEEFQLSENNFNQNSTLEDRIIIPSSKCGIIYINGYNFVKESIIKITIPNNIKSIKSFAFYKLKYLQCVVITNSVISISYPAFYLCDNLELLITEEGSPIEKYFKRYHKNIRIEYIKN